MGFAGRTLGLAVGGVVTLASAQPATKTRATPAKAATAPQAPAAPVPTAPAKASTAPGENPTTVVTTPTKPIVENSLEVFLALLREYKNYPEFFAMISKGDKTFADLDARVVARLPKKVLESRIRQFNTDFVVYRKLKAVKSRELADKKAKLDETAISDLANRGDLELKVKALESQTRQVKKVLFLLSVDANTSVLEAIETLPPALRVVDDHKAGAAGAGGGVGAGAAAIPKMPGVFGGSREQRLSQKETDKINLTPVDKEFTNTQLGKKLVSDLGAPIDAWSYDYKSDELYVAVGKNISKVRVKEESPGIRYIQTRVGARFEEPIGADTKVDMLTAKGKFLTGEGNEATLFGKMPEGQKYMDQLPPGHSENDGHDHHHDH